MQLPIGNPQKSSLANRSMVQLAVVTVFLVSSAFMQSSMAYAAARATSQARNRFAPVVLPGRRLREATAPKPV